MRSKVFRLSADAAADRRCFYYFLMAVIVIRYETAATARWTSPFIVRAFFNDTITVAVWTGFHARLIHILPHPSNGRAAMGGMMQMAVLFAGASRFTPESGRAAHVILQCAQSKSDRRPPPSSCSPSATPDTSA